MWVGEKKFFRKGKEETFVRFTIDPDGDQIGDFEYEEKKFVIPYQRNVGVTAPDIIDDETEGGTYIGVSPGSHPNGGDSDYDPERGW